MMVAVIDICLGDGFIGHIPMVWEWIFSLIFLVMGGLHPCCLHDIYVCLVQGTKWCFGCCYASHLGFYGGDHTVYSWHLEVCVEGHTIGFGLQCFSLCFGYLPGCSYSHYIGWRLLWSYVLISFVFLICHVGDDMVVPFISFFCWCGEHGRMLETWCESGTCSLLVYMMFILMWMFLILHGYTSMICF